MKAGLLLGLFGGSQRGGHVSIRGDPHILVVGDPGLGKSQVSYHQTIFVCMNSIVQLTACFSYDPWGVL